MSKKFKIFVYISIFLSAAMGVYLYLGRSKVKDLAPEELAAVQAKNAEYLKNWQDIQAKKKKEAEDFAKAQALGLKPGEKPPEPEGPVKLLEQSEQPEIPGYANMSETEKVAAVAELTRTKVRKKFGAVESRLVSEPYPREDVNAPPPPKRGRQPLKKLRQYIYTKLYGVRTSFVAAEGIPKPQMNQLKNVFDNSCMSDRAVDNVKCKHFILADAELLKSLVETSTIPENKSYKIYCPEKDCLDPFEDTTKLVITEMEMPEAQLVGSELEVVKLRKKN